MLKFMTDEKTIYNLINVLWHVISLVEWCGSSPMKDDSH